MFQEKCVFGRLRRSPSTAGRRAWGAIVRALARLDRARADGLDVTCDAYTAGSTALLAMLPPWVIADGVSAMLAAIAPNGSISWSSSRGTAARGNG